MADDMNTDKPEFPDFYVGYSPLPNRDRRFLLKAVPLGLVGLAVSGGAIGAMARSAGGGRWETGTPVTLEGRVGFHPYPVLWHEGQGIVLAGIGKHGADPLFQPYDGQTVRVTGVRIVREACYMLGVNAGDITPIKAPLPALPEAIAGEPLTIMGEIVDAQCFMGIMNPGYGRTHQGCATLCIRGGQPVYMSIGASDGKGGGTTCNGNGFLLADEQGNKINAQILTKIARPVMLTGQLDTIGPLMRLRVDAQAITVL